MAIYELNLQRLQKVTQRINVFLELFRLSSAVRSLPCQIKASLARLRDCYTVRLFLRSQIYVNEKFGKEVILPFCLQQKDHQGSIVIKAKID